MRSVQVLRGSQLRADLPRVRANLNSGRSTTQQYTSFFAQDTWRVGNRLTIRPGIRYEQQKLVGTLADFDWNGNWAPRIGATYDVRRQRPLEAVCELGPVLRQGAERPRGARAVGGRRRDPRRLLRCGAHAADSGRRSGRANLETRHLIFAGLHPSDFDPDSKSTYLDETLVGFEFEPFSNMNLGVRWVHRRFGRILEDVGTVPIAGFFLPAGGAARRILHHQPRSEHAGVPVPGFDISFEDAIHDYDAIELTADKRFSNNWGLQTSYRWSRLHGTFEGFFRNDNGQSDPAITSLFDFPTNDPSYAAIGSASSASAVTSATSGRRARGRSRPIARTSSRCTATTP